MVESESPGALGIMSVRAAVTPSTVRALFLARQNVGVDIAAHWPDQICNGVGMTLKRESRPARRIIPNEPLAPLRTAYARPGDLGKRGGAMRTDRADPWGFDLYDPRITIRQLAADAQRKYEPEMLEPDEAVPDEESLSEVQDRELVSGGSR